MPRSAIPDAVAAIKEISRKHDIPIAIFGHAGDGNLHPNILFDKRDPAQVEKMKKAAADIFDVSVRLGGTLSGEHGVGNLKLAFLEQDIGPLSIDVMAGIKAGAGSQEHPESGQGGTRRRTRRATNSFPGRSMPAGAATQTQVAH